MKTLLAIFAHSGTEATLARHYPIWRRHESDIIILSPTDAPVRRQFKSVQYIDSCNGQYTGALAITRFKTAFNWLSALPYDTFAVLEYDGIILSKEIPNPGNLFFGNEFEAKDLRWSLAFKSPFYYHCPWLMSKWTLLRLCDAMRTLDNLKEGGCFDRYLGLACDQTGITRAGFGPLGFSNDPISDRLIPSMESAIQNGAVMIHGIKNEKTLDAAVRAYQKRALAQVNSESRSILHRGQFASNVQTLEAA